MYQSSSLSKMKLRGKNESVQSGQAKPGQDISNKDKGEEQNSDLFWWLVSFPN